MDKFRREANLLSPCTQYTQREPARAINLRNAAVQSPCFKIVASLRAHSLLVKRRNAHVQLVSPRLDDRLCKWYFARADKPGANIHGIP